MVYLAFGFRQLGIPLVRLLIAQLSLSHCQFVSLLLLLVACRFMGAFGTML